MNKERDDEREARRIVEKVLGIALVHADRNGGVDYRSTDGRHAVEVTRVTDGRVRAGRQALVASRETGVPVGELRSCWVVSVAATQEQLKTLLQRSHPALVDLELTGETSFESRRAAAHVLRGGCSSHIYQPLLDAGVQWAMALPKHGHRAGMHRVIPTLGSGGSIGDSDEALDLLTAALSRKPYNPKKLRASGAEHRHLFVWVDDDTRYDISHPLSREGDEREDFGLPSRPPSLEPTITLLWVVHQEWDETNTGTGRSRPST